MTGQCDKSSANRPETIREIRYEITRGATLATGEGEGGDAEGDRLSGIEHLVGSAHGDTLIGDGGANRLEGGAGGDRLDGGAGEDTLSYAGSGAGVSVNLATGAVSGGDAQGDTIAGFEHVVGSAHDDLLRGDDGANRLHGGAGDDWLWGGAGSDTLAGGAGDDVLEGGAGADRLDGGAGEDVLSYAGSGAGVNVNLATGAVSGGDAQGDTIAGFEHVLGSAHADTLRGDGGANRLWGGAGDDRLYGGAGDDVLEGGAGADRLDGGAGEDALSYAGSVAGVNVNLATGAVSGGDAQGDTFTGFEHVAGSAHDDVLRGDGGANRLYGGSGADRLYGGAGSDALHGGDGDDVLEGGAGADRLEGGAGEDTLSYAGSGAAVYVNLATGAVSGGDAQGDTIAGFEHVVGSAHGDLLSGDDGANRLSGGSGADWLYGNGGDDRLDGGSGGDVLYGRNGNDRLAGGSGADRLYGGAGEDVLEGGSGADRLYGEGGADTLSYAGSVAGVRVDLATRAVSGGDAEGDKIAGFEHVEGSAHGDTLRGDGGANRLSGGSGADRLFGQGGADRLDGGTGSDTLVGGAGDDWLEGGAGGDRLYGGSGEDTASYADSGAGVNVSLATGRGQGGDAEGDRLYQVEHLVGSGHDDTLTGDARDNRLSGGEGADTLSGGAGADILIGGAGSDVLTGGAGDDLFRFASGDGADTIADFTDGEDRIDLEAYDLVGGFAGLNASQSGQDVVIDLGGGDRITLTGVELSTLDASDFLF